MAIVFAYSVSVALNLMVFTWWIFTVFISGTSNSLRATFVDFSMEDYIRVTSALK